MRMLSEELVPQQHVLLGGPYHPISRLSGVHSSVASTSWLWRTTTSQVERMLVQSISDSTRTRRRFNSSIPWWGKMFMICWLVAEAWAISNPWMPINLP